MSSSPPGPSLQDPAQSGITSNNNNSNSNSKNYHPYLYRDSNSSFYFPSPSPIPFANHHRGRRSSLELYPRSSIALPPSFEEEGESTPSTPSALQTWTPLVLWALTSVGFLLAVTVWRTELFQALDDFSQYLKSDLYYGYSILFICIFVTTFPPFPLYSTFIVLSGYTFGAWTGFLISYSAALSGAIVVYCLSLHFFRSSLSCMLSRAVWMRRVLIAIDKRPTLLFLIRLAPYPYNLLNAILAASPSLTFKTYVSCTALSLFKLIIHTWAGSAIRNFAGSVSSSSSSVQSPNDSTPFGMEEEKEEENELVRYWTYFGLILSIGIFGYLSYLAKKTVEERATEAEEEGDSMRIGSDEMRQVRGGLRSLDA